jgi:hypothetical protein
MVLCLRPRMTAMRPGIRAMLFRVPDSGAFRDARDEMGQVLNELRTAASCMEMT